MADAPDVQMDVVWPRTLAETVAEMADASTATVVAAAESNVTSRRIIDATRARIYQSRQTIAAAEGTLHTGALLKFDDTGEEA
jgi:hypothetical protein